MTNNRAAFEAARVFIVIVSMANVVLLGRLVRRRHWVGVLVAVMVLAFYGDSITADHTILLEPLLVFGTLLGLLFAFDDTECATSSATRWLAAGAMLGLTTSIKTWGAFPLLVLLAYAVMRGRRCVTHYVAGALAAIVIVCGPFFVLAPVAFIREVIVVQLTRSHAGYASEELRLMNLLGVPGQALGHALLLLILLWSAVVVVIFASIVFQMRVDPSRAITSLDIAAMVCLVLVGASFLVASEFEDHYGGFLAVFIALVLSATAVRLLPIAKRLMTIAIVVITAGVVLLSVHHASQFAKEPLPTSALDRIFPPTACVVSVDYGPLILANRFNLFEPQCPRVLDTYGTELADGDGITNSLSDSRVPKLQADWSDWLHHADGLVLASPASKYVVFGTPVRAYIDSHFSLSAVSDGLYIYSRVQSS